MSLSSFFKAGTQASEVTRALNEAAAEAQKNPMLTVKHKVLESALASAPTLTPEETAAVQAYVDYRKMPLGAIKPSDASSSTPTAIPTATAQETGTYTDIVKTVFGKANIIEISSADVAKYLEEYIVEGFDAPEYICDGIEIFSLADNPYDRPDMRELIACGTPILDAMMFVYAEEEKKKAFSLKKQVKFESDEIVAKVNQSIREFAAATFHLLLTASWPKQGDYAAKIVQPLIGRETTWPALTNPFTTGEIQAIPTGFIEYLDWSRLPTNFTNRMQLAVAGSRGVRLLSSCTHTDAADSEVSGMLTRLKAAKVMQQVCWNHHPCTRTGADQNAFGTFTSEMLSLLAHSSTSETWDRLAVDKVVRENQVWANYRDTETWKNIKIAAIEALEPRPLFPDRSQSASS